jgi:D-3-phosphoglycerate dehydrogenase / 2-oxoglutarate reductase
MDNAPGDSLPEVLISENITGAAVEELKREHAVSFQPALWNDGAGLSAAVRSARALIVRNQTRVTAELIAAAGKLEVIGRAGVGLDNVDVAAASAAGIVVAFTPSQNSISVAELALGLMLALVRKIVAADRHVRSGGWARHQFMGSELWGKTLGVVGLGRIGCMTARRAAAFGMEIVAYDPLADLDSPLITELRPRMLSLDDLLAEADIVSCHVPLTPQTRGLLGFAQFQRMKPSAILINVARGEIIDEPGLVRALQEGIIAGAGLDVRESEPPQLGALESMENVVLMPHVGAFTNEGQDRVTSAVCRDVAAVLAGRAARNYVNFATPKRVLLR